MNEELTPRIYREYCWFALLLVILTIGFVSHPGELSALADTGRAPPAPAHQTP
jgi:hypothetical protein